MGELEEGRLEEKIFVIFWEWGQRGKDKYVLEVGSAMVVCFSLDHNELRKLCFRNVFQRLKDTSQKVKQTSNQQKAKQQKPKQQQKEGFIWKPCHKNSVS